MTRAVIAAFEHLVVAARRQVIKWARCGLCTRSNYAVTERPIIRAILSCPVVLTTGRDTLPYDALPGLTTVAELLDLTKFSGDAKNQAGQAR